MHLRLKTPPNTRKSINTIYQTKSESEIYVNIFDETGLSVGGLSDEIIPKTFPLVPDNHTLKPANL